MPERKAADVEYHAAIATFQAVLPVESTEEWARQEDGTWLCRNTGEVREIQP